MTLRRLLAGIPLAAIAGLLVHMACAGSDHVPGLGQAPTLAGLLSTALLLAVLTTFLGAALGPGRSSIATNASNGASMAALTAGGLAAYVALELIEGHGFAGSFTALASAPPAAFLVLWAARSVRAILQAAGTAFAAYARGPRIAEAGSFSIPCDRRRSQPTILVPWVKRGRAPPEFA